MQQTTNYNLAKPEYTDAADIAPISGNMDTIDTALEKARSRDADVYNQNNSYTVGDFCIYQDTLYKCTGTTTGAWDNTKWTACKIADAFEPKHTWTLFETLTADGVERILASSVFSSKVTGIMIQATVAAAAANLTLGASVSFDGGTTWKNICGISNGINTGVRYNRITYKKDGDMWEATNTAPFTSTSTTAALQTRYEALTIGGDVNRVRVFAPTGEVMPSGSTFEIYIRQ